MPQLPAWAIWTIYIATVATSIAVSANQQAIAKRAQRREYRKGIHKIENRFDTAAAHALIYGRTRVGGSIIFASNVGDEAKTYNSFWALAGHEVDAIECAYIDDTLVWESSTGNVVPKYSRVASFWAFTGKADQDMAYPSLTGRTDGQWTSNHRCRGIAYIATSLLWDRDIYGTSLPSVTYTVRGKKVRDPRFDTYNLQVYNVSADNQNIELVDTSDVASVWSKLKTGMTVTGPNIPAGAKIVSINSGGTYFAVDKTITPSTTPYTVNIKAEAVYSNNPALCILDYLQNVKQYPDEVIDFDSFIHAANVCDIPILKKYNYSYSDRQLTANGTEVVMPNITNLKEGMLVTGDGIDADTRIVAMTSPVWVPIYNGDSGIDEGYWDGYYSITLSKPAIKSTTTTINIDQYEPQYTVNGIWYSDENPADILDDLRQACNADLYQANGKWKLRVGEWTEPVGIIDETNMSEDISISLDASSKDSYNIVKGVFAPESTFWQATNYPRIWSDAFIEQDGGYEQIMQLDLLYTETPSMAQRIAKQVLLASRLKETIEVKCDLSVFKYEIGDNVIVQNRKLGWTDTSNIFRVIQVTPDFRNGTITLVLTRTSPDVYDWNVTDEQFLEDTKYVLTTTDIVPPYGLSGSFYTDEDVSGRYQTFVRADWKQTSSFYMQTEVQYKVSGSDEWSLVASIPESTQQNYVEFPINQARLEYDLRVRNLDLIGKASSWVSASIYVEGDNVPPQNPYPEGSYGLNISGGFYFNGQNAQSQGVSGLWWNIYPQIDKDYSYTRIGKIIDVPFSVWSGTSSYGLNIDIVGASTNFSNAKSGRYFYSIQNVDTSGNTSSLQYGYFDHVGTDVIVGQPGSTGASGSKGDTVENRYKRSSITPATPTGDDPTAQGWLKTPSIDDGTALWLSWALRSGVTSLITGSWSTPSRMSGNVSFYQANAPVNNVDATLSVGDLWWDTDDKNKVYRWDGSQWVSVQDGNIPSITSSLVTISSSLLTLDTNIKNTLLSASQWNANALASASQWDAATYISASALVGTVSQSVYTLSQTVNSNSASYASSLTSTNAIVFANSQSAAITMDSIKSSVTSNSASAASSITTTKASITSLSSSVAYDISTLGTRVTTISGSTAADIVSVKNTISSTSGSIALDISSLNTKTTSNSASLAADITTTKTTITSVSSSLAASLVSISSSFASTTTATNASVTTLSGTYSSNSGSVAARFDTLQSTTNGYSASFSARLTTDEAVSTTLSSSMATRMTTLEASTGTTQLSQSFAARLTTDEGVITTNSSSLAQRITTLNSSYGSLSSTVSNLQTSQTSISQSMASQINTVSATAANANSTANTAYNTANTANSTANAAQSSVSTISTAVANLSSGVSASYSLVVTAGNRVTGFKSEANGTSTSFTIQADKFTVVNTSGGQSKVPFLIDGNGVYIDSAVIRSLDAGKITAGTISAAITINAPTINGGTLTGASIIVTSNIGMRYQDDAGVFTITGGSGNGVQHGAQIDLSGVSESTTYGILSLSAGDGLNSSYGYIRFGTGPRFWDASHNSYANYERMRITYDGNVIINNNASIGGCITSDLKLNATKLGFNSDGSIYAKDNFGPEFACSNGGGLWPLRTKVGLVVGAVGYGAAITPGQIVIATGTSEPGAITSAASLYVGTDGNLKFKREDGTVFSLTS